MAAAIQQYGSQYDLPKLHRWQESQSSLSSTPKGLWLKPNKSENKAQLEWPYCGWPFLPTGCNKVWQWREGANKTIKDGEIAPWIWKDLNKDKRKEQRDNYILIWGGSSSVSIFFTSAFVPLALRLCVCRICRWYEVSWHSLDFYWLSTNFYLLSTDFYWLPTDFYRLSTDVYWLSTESLLTFTDSLLTSTDSLLTSTDSLLTFTDFYGLSTYFYWLSTDFYWLSTDSLLTLYLLLLTLYWLLLTLYWLPNSVWDIWTQLRTTKPICRMGWDGTGRILELTDYKSTAWRC